jgi:hypothetical protein
MPAPLMPPPTTSTSQSPIALSTPKASRAPAAPGSGETRSAGIEAAVKVSPWIELAGQSNGHPAMAVGKFAILFFFFLFSANMRVSTEG